MNFMLSLQNAIFQSFSINGHRLKIEMNYQSKLNDLLKFPHCQNCGTTNPEMYSGFEYTSCCNEAICDGVEKYKFYNKKISVNACCWAVAEFKFNIKGIKVLEEEGMSRVPLNEIEE